MKRRKRGGAQVKAAPVKARIESLGSPILRTPMRVEEYQKLARDVAQQEIMAVANALAKQVYGAVAAGIDLAPVVARVDAVVAEQSRFNVVLNAIAEMMIDKGVFTREELTAKAEALADKAIRDNQERHRTIVAKARQQREADAAESESEAAEAIQPLALEGEPEVEVEAEAEAGGE